MPVNITDVDEFTDPIVAPADSDPADRTYVVTIAQGTANRTRYLYERLVGAGGDHQFDPPVAGRKVILSPHLARADANGGGTTWDTDGGSDDLASRVASGLAIFDLNRFIPHGAFPTAIKALVLPGAARTGTNRMRLRLLTRNLNFDTPAAPASVEIASAFDDGTAVLQVITLSGFGGLFVDSADYLYRVELKAGNTGDSFPDFFAGLEITFEDHGLRNT